MIDTIKQDALEFGRHDQHGGWIQGLLVARNVDPGSRPPQTEAQLANLKNRKTPANVEPSERGAFDKVSAQAFGKASGRTTATVLRYYEGWQAAAAVGLVPNASTLKPGDGVELPEAESWKEYVSTTERAQKDAVTGTERSFRALVKTDPGAVVRAFDSLESEQREMVVQDIVQHREFADAVKSNPVVRDEMLINVMGTPEQRRDRREENERLAIEKHGVHGWRLVIDGLGEANLGLTHALDALVKLAINRGVDPDEDPLMLARGRAEMVGRSIHEVEMAWGETPITDKIEELRANVRS